MVLNKGKSLKVLLLLENIMNYRIAVYDALGHIYNLTIAYTSKDESRENVSYERIRLKCKKYGCIYWVEDVMRMCRNFHVVIYMPNIRFVSYCMVPFVHNRCYKAIPFSIGIRASYKRHYDLNRKKTLLDRLFGMIQFKGDAVLVYFKESLSFWNLNPKEEEKCFETRNTTDVLKDFTTKDTNKNSFIFIGSLYKEKRVDLLILAYNDAFKKVKSPTFPSLEIIGAGNEMEKLGNMIEQLGLLGKVHLRGQINEELVLAQFFSNALLCISPNQAGLSVAKSMGYGVPFVTIKNAITGGEIFHIKNAKNGILMDSFSELSEILLDAHFNKDKYLTLGLNAKAYYNEEANIPVMVKGFVDAIEYSLKH